MIKRKLYFCVIRNYELQESPPTWEIIELLYLYSTQIYNNRPIYIIRCKSIFRREIQKVDHRTKYNTVNSFKTTSVGAIFYALPS